MFSSANISKRVFVKCYATRPGQAVLRGSSFQTASPRLGRGVHTAAMAPKYTLYTWGTPNGWKASVTMEELGLDFEVKPVDISTNAQKEDWFLKINPNGRIPALVDHEADDLAVFETGAIMWYLGEKADPSGSLYPKDFKKRAEVMSWLMFQMGGVGPMQGQANHFLRYAPTKIKYGIDRYVGETERLFDVLESRLQESEWLAAGQYSLADIANFCWVVMGPWAGVDWRSRPALKAWVEKIAARPAVKKGLAIPTEGKFARMGVDEQMYKDTLAEAKKIRDEVASQ